MTALAPNARAFMMCPDDEIPPSAMTGMPCLDATFVTLYLCSSVGVRVYVIIEFVFER